MSTTNDNSFSTITTQSGNDGINFKDYHFGYKRANKNGSKLWICTHEMCNAIVKTSDNSIVKTSFIKSDRKHEYEHPTKMALNVYDCIN
ncbi:unnamed protein product [Adineta steineri]|uniref:FLYWCH-type domain-containing protein n=1 Tax=Adineta steineri TaxID=433720 RepID=A0A814NXK0_9BILA|nr:unnamed protein product [Adineta steineri]CAF3695492.1 unnamed protein product [Adineta steineri]